MKKPIKKIHFVGIKGVGMSALAIIAKEAGFRVSGSDIGEEFITDVSLKKAKIEPFVGFNKNNVIGSDLVIVTGAHNGFDNVEALEAKKNGISVTTQGQALGEFMEGKILDKDFEKISVSGAHGKTTTTAMIATVLKENDLDPTFLVGTGYVESLGSNGHFGKGKYFVAEADEYATEPNYDKTPKFLWQKPDIGVITNIEFDHPDLYNTLDDLRKAFTDFANNISANGALVTCMDDLEVQQILKDYKKKKITYGFSKIADFYIEKISIGQDRMFFWVKTGDTLLGEFSLSVTGEHNALNALCSIVVCLELGLSVQNIKKGLAAFKGTKRRFEFIGTLPEGAVLYDDYAHHPTEIRKTLQAVRKTYPGKKIVCIFQPHTYSRTKSLFEQFISSFIDSDLTVITDIFPSFRENGKNLISSKELSDAISKTKKDVLYIAKLDDVVKYVDQSAFDKDFIVITMGAGDIYKINNHLIK